ncbi:MAG: hypothetical protein HRU38_08535 [Saccharospirillaceae bacterium]|nr:hypothetical protein [Pseudomonadales bacterium]NRB78700.1 hypothetical protein [Saccharospirillaceae bacterium]
MEAAQSITEKLTNIIGDRKVLSAIFTTFNFEPNFFELDIIAELLAQDICYSADERIKTFQVREALRLSNLPISVFFDKQMFISEADQSPQMEYLCHGVNKGNACFHAKNIYLLVEDETTKTESLLIASGSNNITRAGWWKNIEVQHWEEITVKGTSKRFIEALKKDIKSLDNYSRAQKDNDRALITIKNYLDKINIRKSGGNIHYYGLQDGNWFDWLSTLEGTPLGATAQWNLEIISPFFCENSKDNLHTKFWEIGVKNISMLLPIDIDKKALCDTNYFEHINNCDNIEWAQWQDNITASMTKGTDIFRNLHAKIYHFYNDVQAWLFVGSINFSNKACSIYNEKSSNIESGFFIKIKVNGPMLQSLNCDTYKDFKQSTEDNIPINNESNNDIKVQIPDIAISYDWKDKILIASIEDDKAYKINIIANDNKTIIENWDVNKAYNNSIESLEKELTNGAFVRVTGVDTHTQIEFPTHKVMIQQTGWSHKELDIPKLTPEQILAIYAGMSPSQRQSTMLNAILKKLIQQNLSGENTTVDSTQTDVDLFCEYAEIFTSFKNFKTLLNSSLESKSQDVDYYISGTGMDSLPTLLKLLEDSNTVNSKTFDPVNSYLILLSAQELLMIPSFKSRANTKKTINDITKKITLIKKEIQFKDDPTVEFFDWFEEQFRMEYKTIDNTKQVTQ